MMYGIIGTHQPQSIAATVSVLFSELIVLQASLWRNVSDKIHAFQFGAGLWLPVSVELLPLADFTQGFLLPFT
ncbi:hypothetical protein A8V49_10295 [Yersinia pestis]|nr:hypothetical protein AVJ24_08035 [Yersinia pestis]PCN66875.1 hypothetical protein A8V49_10295 [Yersinia pestis]PVU32233.1 hypothetical protein A8M58_02050 [Yersinia pestis]